MATSLTIQIPSPLLRYSEGQTSLDVEAQTVGAALDALFAVFPGLASRVLDKNGNIPPYLILLHAGEALVRDDFRDHVVQAGDSLDIIPAVEGGNSSGDDVRMRGFKKRATVAEARSEAMAGLSWRSETLAIAEAAGRVLASDVASQIDVPTFDRSAMDGFALCGEDSFGATLYDPVRLELVGEVMPGMEKLPSLARGQALRIMTGAPIPPGADAVLMAEDAKEEQGAVLVQAPVTPGKNVGRRGEDIRAGETLLSAGRKLRPQDVGLLASIGAAVVEVIAKPRAAILVTGNELLPPGEMPGPGRVADSNTPMLRALMEADGAEVVLEFRLADEPDIIARALVRSEVDILVAAGGSSVGREDWLPVLTREYGELPIHGIAMRPSSPTGIGRVDDKKVFLLPGNPVSCLAAYDFFAGPAIRFLSGLEPGWPYPRETRRLARRVSSQVGRLDYLRVKIETDGRVVPLALSGAAILSSTTRADAFAIIPADSEGFDEGKEIEVFFYDRRHVDGRA